MNRVKLMNDFLSACIPHTRGDEPTENFGRIEERRIPHTRGDEPVSKRLLRASSMYSPHPWG